MRVQTKQEYDLEIQRLKTEILKHESHLWELQEKINNHNDLLKEIKRNSVGAEEAYKKQHLELINKQEEQSHSFIKDLEDTAHRLNTLEKNLDEREKILNKEKVEVVEFKEKMYNITKKNNKKEKELIDREIKLEKLEEQIEINNKKAKDNKKKTEQELKKIQEVSLKIELTNKRLESEISEFNTLKQFQMKVYEQNNQNLKAREGALLYEQQELENQKLYINSQLSQLVSARKHLQIN